MVGIETFTAVAHCTLPADCVKLSNCSGYFGDVIGLILKMAELKLRLKLKLTLS